MYFPNFENIHKIKISFVFTDFRNCLRVTFIVHYSDLSTRNIGIYDGIKQNGTHSFEKVNFH